MTMATANNEQDANLVSTAMPADYYRLMKPRVMYLVIFTAVIGMLMAPGSINPIIACLAILCISIGAGASGSLNMWYDADIDVVMARTSDRPIPGGRVLPKEALTFGLVLSFFSVIMLGLLVNYLSAFLLAFTIFFYAVIYTMSIIFLWTPPHFWALALFRLKDYENASVPMMPNVAGEKSTRNQIFGYSILLAISGVLPAVMGFASLGYGIVATALCAYFVWCAYKVWSEGSEENNFAHEKRLFGYSIVFLFALFASLGIDAIFMKWVLV